jgi:HD-GYP domain-containing protein (c-di-GMP phosphodiesterase class II)
VQARPDSSGTTLEAPPGLHRVAQALQDAFGVPFVFRTPGEAWAALPMEDSWDAAAALSPHCITELSLWLDGPDTRVCTINCDDGVLVAMRLSKLYGLIATGVVPGADARLLRRMAGILLEKLDLVDLVKTYQCELDGCLEQIGEDFEELTFLRQLCEYLDMVRLHHGPVQVAELVLTELMPLIHAEAVVLVLTRQTGSETSGTHVWIGEQVTTPEGCQRLIHECGATAAKRALVNNQVASLKAAEQFAGVREVMIAPLVKRESVLGWLLALNRVPTQPSPRQREIDEKSYHEFGSVQATLLSSVASMLATHTNNIELFRQRETLLVSVVRSMVSAIDAKDHYTRGHSERVALVARALAVRLRLPDDECDRIYLAGLLHDIGKIGISDAVLHKPDHLTPAEFDQIKGHPDQGWAILKDLDQLSHILPGVLHHHERYDGRGYPDGLAGQAIPLTARILAVADAYDAMCSDRPYRRGMPLSKVEEILRSGSGTHWDPTIVTSLLESMADIQVLWREYQEPAIPQRCLPAVAAAAAAAGMKVPER